MMGYLTPFNNFLKKEQKVIITPPMEDVIRKCIGWLQEELVLAFPDFMKEFTITNDTRE